MNIIYFGTPEFAVPPFRSLLHSEHRVLTVVTQPDRQKGRGRHVSSCPVKAEAEMMGLKILQPLKVRDDVFIAELKAESPDAIVVVAYGQLLPSAILGMPKYGCINVHASLLPRYRGAAPINWAIINGEKKTGITTMLMDEGMDTGPLLLQYETDIASSDTAGSLSHRLSELGADVLLKTLQGIEDGSVRPVPQAGEATYAPILKKNDGLIDWTMSAQQICNRIRGMDPWPGAFSFLGKERIKIISAVPEEGVGVPGVIEEASKDLLVIGTGSGLLQVLKIQPEGRAVMTVYAFLQGRKITSGLKFGLAGKMHD